MEDVRGLRSVCSWLAANKNLFGGDIRMPFAADLDDAATGHWVGRVEMTRHFV